MSDLVTVSQKLEDALEAVNALRERLIQLVVNTEGEKPQPVEQSSTTSQPVDDTTQKVPIVTPHVEQGTTGGNFSA